MRKSKTIVSANVEDSFTTSLSDLMAGLLGLFILALCVFMLNFQRVTSQYAGNLQTRSSMLRDVERNMMNHGVQIYIDSKQGVLRIPESVLFESGHADIKPEGRQAIQQLSQILYGELTKPEYKNAVETVFIEGHTDNVPIQNQYFQSNWELSTQRAINTWNLMRFDVVGLNTLVNANGVPIFSCSGYADTRPVKDDAFDENSVEGRQANRRIDIRFVMMPPKDSNAER